MVSSTHKAMTPSKPAARPSPGEAIAPCSPKGFDMVLSLFMAWRRRLYRWFQPADNQRGCTPAPCSRQRRPRTTHRHPPPLLLQSAPLSVSRKSAPLRCVRIDQNQSRKPPPAPPKPNPTPRCLLRRQAPHVTALLRIQQGVSTWDRGGWASPPTPDEHGLTFVPLTGYLRSRALDSFFSLQAI